MGVDAGAAAGYVGAGGGVSKDIGDSGVGVATAGGCTVVTASCAEAAMQNPRHIGAIRYFEIMEKRGETSREGRER
jgi:hypothetical protein